MEIRAEDVERVLGKYLLTHYRPWNCRTKQKEYHHYGGNIYSSKSGFGIPRALIIAAAEEIQKIATMAQSQIIHEAKFLTPDSEKLIHIYLDYGYILEDDSAFRMFLPNAF